MIRQLEYAFEQAFADIERGYEYGIKEEDMRDLAERICGYTDDFLDHKTIDAIRLTSLIKQKESIEKEIAELTCSL